MSTTSMRSNPTSRPGSRPGSQAGSQVADASEFIALQDMYLEVTERIPIDLQNTCSAVLYAMVRTISSQLGEATHAIAYYPENQVLLKDGLMNVPLVGDAASFSALLLRNESEDVAAQVRNDITLAQMDDSLMLRAAQYIGVDRSVNARSSVVVYDASLYMEVMEFERRALIRRQIVRLLASSNYCGFPHSPDCYPQRSIDETELLTFSPLTAPEFHRANQMLTAHRFMLGHTKVAPNFTGLKSSSGDGGGIHQRKYHRPIAALTFAQLLAQESLKEPLVLSTYYPLTDELLYVLHWPPPDRRVGRCSWVYEGSPGRSSATGSKGSRNRLPGQPFQLDWTRYAQETITMTPAGDALVFVKSLASTKAAWLSIHLQGAVFGLRIKESASEKPQAKAAVLPKKVAEAVSVDDVEGGDARLAEGGAAAGDAGASIDSAGHPSKGIDIESDPLALDGAEKGDEAPVEVSQTRSVASKTRSASSSGGLSGGGLKDTVWFCQSEDSRIIVVPGPSPQPPTKPDKLGTMCLLVTAQSGLTVTACSNGTIRFSSVVEEVLHPGGKNEPLGEETSRFVACGGTVTRVLGHGPYSRDILSPNGTRTLFNRTPGQAIGLQYIRGFHNRLLKNAPAHWTYVRLCATGTVMFYSNKPGSAESAPVRHPEMENISSSSVDAETQARVLGYMDGRVLVLHRDGLREAVFPDGTTIRTAGSAVTYISKQGLPPVEIDIDIDRTAFRHAQGLQVPIAKAGERVRARIGLSDGSALMIKYDTRITAVTNGLLKLVRRDRSAVIVLDNGLVNYLPRTSWDDIAAQEFATECADCWVPPVIPALAPSSSRADVGSRAALHHSVSFTSVVGAPDQGLGKLGTFGGVMSSMISDSASTLKKPSVLRENSQADGPGGGSAPAFPTTQSVAQPADAPPSSLQPADRTKYLINVLDWTCKIEDYEFNRFSIDLHDPLAPAVELSGEVEGLLPSAVTESPLDPRMFVVSRNAAATEVLSAKAHDDVVNLSACCPDALKLAEAVPQVGSEASPWTAHTFFRSRRTGLDDDRLSFESIFSSRPWQSRKRPATASIILRNAAPSSVTSGTSRPRVFETLSLVEREPLSLAQYDQLDADISRWAAYKEARLVNMDCFTVGDSRTQEELLEEESVCARIKAAYKAAKVAASKRRDKESKVTTNTVSASGLSTSESNLGYQAQRPPALELHGSSTIEEGNEESFDDDEPLVRTVCYYFSLLYYRIVSFNRSSSLSLLRSSSSLTQWKKKFSTHSKPMLMAESMAACTMPTFAGR